MAQSKKTLIFSLEFCDHWKLICFDDVLRFLRNYHGGHRVSAKFTSACFLVGRKCFDDRINDEMDIINNEMGIINNVMGIINNEMGIIHNEMGIINNEVGIINNEMDMNCVI